MFKEPARASKLPIQGATGRYKGEKAKGKKAAENLDLKDHLMPEDIHFSSKDLVTLFLKPKFEVRFIERLLGDGWLTGPGF